MEKAAGKPAGTPLTANPARLKYSEGVFS